MNRVSRIDQVKIYTGKCFRIFKNEKGFKLFISTAVITIFIVFVLGDLMFEGLHDTQMGAFALVCGCIWIGIFNSIQSICRERAIIKREYRTGLHISSYVIAHMIYEMVICFVEALIVTSIVLISTGGPNTSLIVGPFFDLFVTFFLVIFSADVLAMIVSSIVKTETEAMTVIPFVLIIQLILSGVIFVLGDLLQSISVITISKWGVNAVCAISNVITSSLPKDLVLLDERVWLESECRHDAGYLLEIWMILCLFAFIYGIVCVIALKFVDKDKR